jgi:hypothetical protein
MSFSNGLVKKQRSVIDVGVKLWESIICPTRRMSSDTEDTDARAVVASGALWSLMGVIGQRSSLVSLQRAVRALSSLCILQTSLHQTGSQLLFKEKRYERRFVQLFVISS